MSTVVLAREQTGGLVASATKGEMSVGWIKLHRSLLDQPRYSDDKWLRIFVHLLLLAKHRPCKATFMGQVVVLRPGQFLTTLPEIASALKIHESSVRRILETLKIDRQIDWESGNKNRLITIVNWEKFQGSDPEELAKSTVKRQASDRQPTDHPVVIKNGKKEKNGKNALPSEETHSSNDTRRGRYTPSAEGASAIREGRIYEQKFLSNSDAEQLAKGNPDLLLALIDAPKAKQHPDGRVEVVQ